MSLENFEEIESIGKGSYSVVHKVKRNTDGKIYALKKVRIGQLKKKEKENSLNEIRILASIQDPWIISYKEAFFEDDALWLIMDYADDGDLYQKIVKHSRSGQYIPERFLWSMIYQAVSGLKSLHDLKILHRDIKSANVFLYRNGDVKIGDFNVSKVAERGLLLTQTGTPYYASPEVWKDQPYDFKSDIWSLGVVIYETAALKPPFRASDMNGLYKKVMKGQYSRLPSVFSNDLNNMIKCLLQLSPSLRPTCDQILTMPVLQRNLETQIQKPRESNSNLISEITMPKDINNLSQNLPAPNYDLGTSHSTRTSHRFDIYSTLPRITLSNKLQVKIAQLDPTRSPSQIRQLSITPTEHLVKPIMPRNHTKILRENYGALKLPTLSTASKSPARITSKNRSFASKYSDQRSRRAMYNRAFNIISNKELLSSNRSGSVSPTRYSHSKSKIPRPSILDLSTPQPI